MLEQAFKFLLENIRSLIITFLFFIFSIVFLPEGIVVWVLKKLRPSIIKTESKKWKSILSIIINILLHNNYTDFNQGKKLKEKLDKIKKLHSNNVAIEKNIYFLDLCIDIFKMLTFALPKVVSGGAEFWIFSEALNYLGYYTNYVTSLEQNKNFPLDVSNSLESLQVAFESLDEVYKNPIIDKNEQKKVFEDTYGKTHDHFINERSSLEKLLEQNKNKMKNLLNNIIDDD
jgi:hypothetical protein